MVSEEGLSISAHALLSRAAECDWVILPAWPSTLPEPGDELVTILRRVHARGGTVIGLCLGAFPVCHSGIVDGRAVATHWRSAEALAQRYPAVEVSPAALYIDHGDVCTSAGTAAALDACLHLVRNACGADVASTVAANLVVAPHRDGNQTKHIVRELPASHAPSDMAELLDYIESHLDCDLSVACLARLFHMSPGHLGRRFLQAIGATAAQWVRQRRLDAARRLLERTELPFSEVAQSVGFRSPHHVPAGLSSGLRHDPAEL